MVTLCKRLPEGPGGNGFSGATTIFYVLNAGDGWEWGNETIINSYMEHSLIPY